MDEQLSLPDLQKIGAKWIERIRACEKREKDWMDDAELAENAYLCEKAAMDTGDGLEFNILHSNVETIVPSIYNSTPAPDIRPRHNVKDPTSKAMSDIFERVISQQIDDNKLDGEIEQGAQDAFLAGRDVVRIKFDADEVPAQTMMQIAYDEFGQPVEQEVEVSPARLENERLIFEVVSWRDYREGPAKRWRDVPWVAYRHCISQEEMDRIEDSEIASTYGRESGDAPTENEEQDVDVWEIWCKDTRKVYFIIEQNNKVVSIQEDPLGLPNFFPQCEPVQPITGTGKRTPVCPYTVYKALAEELNTITLRINAIVKGLKVRGLVAASGDDIESLAEAGDNQLVFSANLENLAATGGLDKAIMWWPIETAVMVLRELYAQREQTKQAIYEITGISDIIRGQGAASETATAQQIKTQWGSLRIKKMQRLIERQVRDLFVLSAEIISRHFSFETLQKASGIQITPELQQALSQPLDNYRIDVESDSTVRADLTKGRQEMSEFLQGTAQFFNTMAPVISQAPQAAGPIVEMYSSFARQFNLGKQAEDALEQFAEMAKQAASQPQPNPEAEAQKAEMEMKAKEMQAKMMLEVEKLKLQGQNLQLDAVGKQMDNQIKQRELGIKSDSLQLEESKAEVDAISRAVEMEMEQEQERPVKVGN